MKKTILTFESISLFIFLCVFVNGCISNSKQASNGEKITGANHNPYQEAQITSLIFPSANNTFGYDIYVDGAILIHQPSRPGLSGNLGFATEEDATKVAELVIQKIRNNEMPPTVTIRELQELGTLK